MDSIRRMALVILILSLTYRRHEPETIYSSLPWVLFILQSLVSHLDDTYPILQGFSLQKIIKKLGTLWSTKFEPTTPLGTTFILTLRSIFKPLYKRVQYAWLRGWPTLSLVQIHTHINSVGDHLMLLCRGGGVKICSTLFIRLWEYTNRWASRVHIELT